MRPSYISEKVGASIDQFYPEIKFPFDTEVFAKSDCEYISLHNAKEKITSNFSIACRDYDVININIFTT